MLSLWASADFTPVGFFLFDTLRDQHRWRHSRLQMNGLQFPAEHEREHLLHWRPVRYLHKIRIQRELTKSFWLFYFQPIVLDSLRLGICAIVLTLRRGPRPARRCRGQN